MAYLENLSQSNRNAVLQTNSQRASRTFTGSTGLDLTPGQLW